MKAPPLPQPIFDGGDHRNGGAAYRKGDIDKWILTGGLAWLFIDDGKNRKRNAMHREGDWFMSDVDNAYQEAAETISKASEAYRAVVAEFKSTIKNDVASISASAAKLQAEHVKAVSAARATIAVLASKEMQDAIANAERLATALTAISELKSHNITFAVLDSKPKT
jgi:hypothetical protein